MPLTEAEVQGIISKYVTGLEKIYPDGVHFSADLLNILTENLRKQPGLGTDSAARDSIAREIIQQLAAQAEPAAV